MTDQEAGIPTQRIGVIESAGEPLRFFVERLRQDEAALRAALRLEWSNGQVEGQIHRLKLLKRQMYGRANFDLLRRRVLFRT